MEQNDVVLQAQINTRIQQRNNAQNEAVALSGRLAAADATIQELNAKVAELTAGDEEETPEEGDT